MSRYSRHNHFPFDVAAMTCRQAFLLLALLAIVAGVPHSAALAQKPGQGPAPVKATLVQREAVTSQQSFVGTVTSIRSSVIGSAVDGRVVEVKVEEGELVTPLSSEPFPLVQLLTGTIQIEIDAANVELQVRQAALQELKIGLPLEIEEANANMAAAKARVQFAKSELERSQKLIETGGGLSRSELEQALSNFQAETESLKAAEVLYRKLQATADVRIKQAEAQVAAQSEAIRLLEDRKSKYTICAPFPGAVTRKLAEVGQWISSGEDVMEMVQMDPIEVTVSVPQGQIQQLQYSLDQAIANKTTLPATVTLDSIPDSLSGTIQRIVPQADLMSRAFPVKIRLSNPRSESGYLLKPGMLAKAQLTMGTTHQKLLVDKDALVLNDQSSMLVVLDRSKNPIVAKPVTVKTGQAVGGMIEVTGDIQAGDWVVIEGNERLRPNQEVKILNADQLTPSPVVTPTGQGDSSMNTANSPVDS